MAKSSIYLDSRRSLKDSNKFPICIRVSHKKDRRYYHSGYHADPALFDKLVNLNIDLRGSNKIIREQLLKMKSKADRIINGMTIFSYGAFNALYKNKENNLFVFDALLNYEELLRNEERLSTADSYKHARQSFEKFVRDKNKIKKPKFGDITLAWLNDYEKWMLDEKYQKNKKGNPNPKSWSTIGINIRNLRRVFNQGISKGLFNKNDFYPFGKDKYVIPSSANVKKALSFEEVNLIYSFDCSKANPLLKNYETRSLNAMQKWKDFWIFSYLCNGVNFKDVASWKWKNYEKGKISFTRKKTARAKKSNLESIEFHLMDEAIKILEKYASEDRAKNNYIFPFYSLDMTSKKKHDVSKQQIKNINTWIGKIAKLLKIKDHVTYQSARHSFATISRNSGASMEYISQALGHNSMKTTKNYLKSFEAKEIKKNQAHLLKVDSSRTYLKIVNK